ncbi:hypothetical protein GUJ93_ZPchr0012g21154 [Zizania palustris]|uniref:Uncharacterized protein n=1 Tax=Zizania palustris TaxID=103762 RepID=A0A8J5WTR2_ZIZPA|nr:hypothetical protein GUJ93_ZPchr0012g21154 [Zizania palustris]KAG8094580.1 hypothetical protein GUJ93_ZPchr0012g21154 [Zizania palustris]KAG8094581.1 hypothetical protein GUJ93_ZPchr0012g21154 [Zizania palustris]KAG8094582.1 hypothetical protein GUJ93_ZPchr0012g21154 [Zizania palustris]KAG8094583.1 hypothetical protein GUJ93_ZPchr0012g21154 [Zizania palustris]
MCLCLARCWPCPPLRLPRRHLPRQTPLCRRHPPSVTTATATRSKRTSSAPIRPSDYAHSPVHHCVAPRDGAGLAAVLHGLPPFAHPSRILSAAAVSRREARLVASVSAVLDRRDVPSGDIALHLAVRLRLASVASALAAAGADPTLQNHAGWTPLQEALCLGCKDIAACLLRAHRLAAWAKLRRRRSREGSDDDGGEEDSGGEKKRVVWSIQKKMCCMWASMH